MQHDTLQEQIETIEAKLAALIRKAETGEQWAEIALIEARDLVPLQNPSARVELLAAYERIEELELVLRGAQVLIEAIHGLDVNGANEAMLTKIYEVLQ